MMVAALLYGLGFEDYCYIIFYQRESPGVIKSLDNVGAYVQPDSFFRTRVVVNYRFVVGFTRPVKCVPHDQHIP